MEIKSINHHSRRSALKTEFEPSITDQSAANDADINIIVARYKQTGILPDIARTTQQFIDTTSIPSFQDAKNSIARAQSLFQEFPSEIRALMKNDPTVAHEFITDPKNAAILQKYGMVTITPVTPPTEPAKTAHNKPQDPPESPPATPIKEK